MMSKIKAGQADWSHRGRWKPVSEQAVDFLKKLLNKDPEQRPNAQQALQHPWLANHAGVSSVAHSGLLSRDALRSLSKYAKASKVKRAVLQLLAQELEPAETNELRETFLAIDKSNEGTICLRDLKDAIRSGGPRSPTRRRSRASPSEVNGSPVSSGHSPVISDMTSGPGSPTTPARTLRRANSGTLDELFSVLDANGDEQIYYSDFLAATLEVRRDLREEAVRATFHRLDADNSGTIGVEDFRNVIGETFEGENVEELLKEVDPTGCGEIGFDAFLRVLEDRDAVPSTPTSATPNARRVQLHGSASKERTVVGFFPEAVEEQQ